LFLRRSESNVLASGAKRGNEVANQIMQRIRAAVGLC
jgi:hypothetical protein